MRHLYKLIFLIFALFNGETFAQSINHNKSNYIDTSFVLHSVRYPGYAREMGLQGTVYATFEIDSTCSIKNIIITNSLCEKFCDEALISDIKQEEIYLKNENKSICVARKVRYVARYKIY